MGYWIIYDVESVCVEKVERDFDDDGAGVDGARLYDDREHFPVLERLALPAE